MTTPTLAPPSTGPEHVRNIALDLVLALVTCGLFNLWVQARQMDAVNAMLGEERYRFLPWFLLTLLTCGLYHVYHEYRFSSDIAAMLGPEAASLPMISLLLSLFGLTIVADAIQQSHINAHHGARGL